MAQLILTEEEKALDSFKDMDNENIGKLCRYGMHWLRERDNEDGIKPIHGWSAALFLITTMHQAGANEITQEVKGVTFDGKTIGDFILTIKKAEGTEIKIPALSDDDNKKND